MRRGEQNDVEALIAEIRSCRICERHLPLGPRPVLSAAPSARIAIIGQAPGLSVHQSGIPWADASGERLRVWLDVTEDEFYDPGLFAIIPMGFCYPGRGGTGDLPPRPECAETWHRPLFDSLQSIRLRVLVGSFAQAAYLPERRQSLTETVLSWREYLPGTVPLPHPSPRNNFWLKKNPWFEARLVPDLRARVADVIA